MRWHNLVLVFLLVTSFGLAGCTTPPEGDPVPVALEDDEAYVRVYVEPPLGLSEYPIWELRAVPRLIAFFAGDNATRAHLGDAGYVDLAKGWPEDWSEEHDEDEYPPTAVQDWMRPRVLWYEGVVPAGNYSVIRIEIIDIEATDESGRPAYVQLMADRLSIGPAEGELFHITPGKAHTFLMKSGISKEGPSSYFIR